MAERGRPLYSDIHSNSFIQDQKVSITFSHFYIIIQYGKTGDFF